jgi:hypothetical protein
MLLVGKPAKSHLSEDLGVVRGDKKYKKYFFPLFQASAGSEMKPLT